MNATITTLQRLSVHDGPGIRTVIFFKGCNMRCKWCHNPETWSNAKQLQYFKEKCICCGTCIEVCPCSSLSFGAEKIIINKEQCNICSICTDNCCTGALTLVGRKISVNELLDEVIKDYPYFISSGGGITLSGGEPLLQHQFIFKFLDACRSEGISTAIETNMSLSWDKVELLLPYVDYWMCDFKIADTEKHRYFTGVNNYQIIKNIAKLVRAGASVTVRTPVIPGVNDNIQEIEAICRILEPYSERIRYELLGFHTLGFSKFETLNMNNELANAKSLSKEKLEELRNVLSAFKLHS